MSVACVEREWGLPPLPTAGPGLHLLLWEEDSAGGAGEGLHVLQACKETKGWRSWESQLSFLSHWINHSTVTSARCVCVYYNPDTFCFLWYGQNMSNSNQKSAISVIQSSRKMIHGLLSILRIFLSIWHVRAVLFEWNLDFRSWFTLLATFLLKPLLYLM